MKAVKILVMMLVMALTDVLLGVFVKRFLASWGAEVVRLSFVLG
jgi:crotonobetainyl-CoA:carnitine CoA-transferase CaiB-like acyl-CoA transferase